MARRIFSIGLYIASAVLAYFAIQGGSHQLAAAAIATAFIAGLVF